MSGVDSTTARGAAAASNEDAVMFSCADETLVGILHRVDRCPHGIGMLIVVGGPQYRVGSHRQFVLMARRFSTAGYPVFRFDYRGMGDSDGAARTFESVDRDIKAAIDVFLQQVPEMQAVVIFGLCDAASAALMYCSSDNRVAGLILANPWARTVAGEAKAYVRHYYGQRLLQVSFWKKAFAGRVGLIRAITGFSKSVLRARGDAGAHSSSDSRLGFLDLMIRGLQEFPGSILFLISQRDLTAQEFMSLCRESGAWGRALSRDTVTCTTLEGADHTFSSKEALVAATDESVRWLAELPPLRKD